MYLKLFLNCLCCIASVMHDVCVDWLKLRVTNHLIDVRSILALEHMFVSLIGNFSTYMVIFLFIFYNLLCCIFCWMLMEILDFKVRLAVEFTKFWLRMNVLRFCRVSSSLKEGFETDHSETLSPSSGSMYFRIIACPRPVHPRKVDFSPGSGRFFSGNPSYFSYSVENPSTRLG